MGDGTAGGKTTPIRFYAVRNTDTGEFLEYGGRGAIWAISLTVRALRDTPEQAREDKASLVDEDARLAEIVGVDYSIVAV